MPFTIALCLLYLSACMDAPVESFDTLYTADAVLYCEDSVFNSPSQTALPYHKSLFKNHQLKIEHSSTLERVKDDNNGYVFAVLMVLTSILLVYSLLRKIELRKCLMSTFSVRHTNILIRDAGLKSDKDLWPISFIYYAILGTAGYAAMIRIFDEHLYGLLDLPLLMGAFLLFSLLRHSLTKLLGFTCNESDAVKMYIICGSLFQQIGAALLIPLTILGYYVEKDLIWVAAVVAALVFVLRLARGLTIVLSKSGNFKLYLFYYLCIIEIIPILILAKVIFTYDSM